MTPPGTGQHLLDRDRSDMGPLGGIEPAGTTHYHPAQSGRVAGDDAHAGVNHADGTGLARVVQLPFRQTSVEPLATGDQAVLAGRQ